METNHILAKVERKRDAPKGNQNARKHSFYSNILDEADQLNFALATNVEGVGDKITLLRIKMKPILENDPDTLNTPTFILKNI
tara:strand:- start:42 stop:290 length:249 start_codon:yes stop_codon:yes gene_type:complete